VPTRLETVCRKWLDLLTMEPHTGGYQGGRPMPNHGETIAENLLVNVNASEIFSITLQDYLGFHPLMHR